ncbi:hypothetical protein RN629_09880 [Sphingomonadaceae bacterium jetA1]|jgi:predicted lipid-binding transport protein (Tim44 family)|uniref:hypothetical protein n=1 Tax=Facivitalis istanbulensis TaxID=3075838 RepID=UPI00348389E0
MTDPDAPVPPAPPGPGATSAGGIFVALGTIGGIIAGLAIGEVTAAVLTGLALGILVALVIWWRDR